MCKVSKIEDMPSMKKVGSQKSLVNGRITSPAFQGAKFDKHGYCIHHPSVQLVKPMKDDAGKAVYQELRQTCPSCQSAKHKSRKNTSLGGGKVKMGHRVHGAPSPSSASRSRSKSRERGNNGQRLTESTSTRARSKSRNAKARREYNTPFDSKGRCHYHKNVQLAAKKMTGGWKVIHTACPKCMEDKFDANDDNRSVKSSSSRKSTRSAAAAGDAKGAYDKNGCCALHPHIQVAKKRVFGTGFKVLRTCPACGGDDVGADDYSVRSGRSSRSNSSRKSTKSTASRGKPGKASKSGRYGALPFDGDGYCCRHPNVQLAKKKALGGFKIIHDVCPECAAEDGGNNNNGGRRKPSRRKSSGTGRVFDDSGSETSSYKSGKSGKSGKSSKSGSSRKKRIRVRNLKTEDEDGNRGRYSGYVDDDHRPHGNGVMKYADGTVYDGVWNDGCKVHGKTTKRKV
mmetsp:Transcript_14305/g.30467  ORF Transcript_14305/g.30467 Transcript_14305/m.30467 type:complete len:455 (-) Transcript_14305:150-1514(-)|eukprot:CAMPEP_0183706940 /NCGR_PEP_ID=MMETSP0737-20130205/3656_1 /TAXON_ID=385413 /ORGANISM="Thalassiosira miniscula, Strain CCMP1093" /LENGTH=454 /DNA_ID=CAMNT_0025934495 /DNA_START=83 /DNA_END=1447 /DNA_ORIENTATION=-